MSASSSHPMPAAAPDSPPASAAPPRRRKRWRVLGWLVAAMAALWVTGVAVLWVWAGSDGSLATVLRWTSAWLPALQAQEVSGALRGQGRVGQLRYAQDGLTVQVQDAELAWQPLALLQGSLQISHLRARLIRIDDQSLPTPSSGPPQSLGLPVRLTVGEWAIGQLDWVGPPALSVHDARGRYAFDGVAHQFTLTQARLADGQYQLRARLGTVGAPDLDAQLTGTLAAPVAQPGAAPVPLALKMSVKGPLTDLRAQAQVQVEKEKKPAAPAAENLQGVGRPAASTTAAQPAHAGGPFADLKARITPWAPQPLPEAQLHLTAIDASAFWPGAPRTQLSGQAEIKPIAGRDSHWQLQAQLRNAVPGALDQQRLPLEALTLNAQWQDGMAVVDELLAQIGDGSLRAQGQWVPAAAATQDSASAAHPTGQDSAPPPPSKPWRLDTRIVNLNPALLHSRIGALPLDGQVSVSGNGKALTLQAHVQARNGAAAASKTAARQTASRLAAATDSVDWQALRLRDAQAQGRWSDGELTLSSLRVRTDDAQLNGQIKARLDTLAGQGQVTLTAPGLQMQIEGAAQADKGAGQFSLTSSDAQKAQRWLQALPIVGAALPPGQASGRLDLTGQWRGGWQDPTLQAQLSVPQLQWQPTAVQPSLQQAKHPDASAQAASTRAVQTAATQTQRNTARLGRHTAPPTVAPQADLAAVPAAKALQGADPGAASLFTPSSASDAKPLPIQLHDMRLTLAGRLSQAQWSLRGQVSQGQRQLQLQSAGDAGFGAGSGAKGRAGDPSEASSASALATGKSAASIWRGQLRQMDLVLTDQALGPGLWRVSSQKPLDVVWQAAQGSSTTGQLDVSAGQWRLTSPGPGGQATLEWLPLRWRAGELRTQGRLSGLPLQWVDLLAGPQMHDAGLQGDLVFDGDWNLTVTPDNVRLNAQVLRQRGDLVYAAPDPVTGATTRVAAGIRQAQLSLTGDSAALALRLLWDSEHLGQAEAHLKTRLNQDATAALGWNWAEAAPLQGQVNARLPRLAVWSALAPPGWRLRGKASFNASVSGSRRTPQLTGSLHADDLGLRSIVDGIEFGEGRLRAEFDGTQLRVQEFRVHGMGGQGQGGVLSATGHFAWAQGQPQARLDATLQQLRASIRADRQVTLSGTVQAVLENHAATIGGQLQVNRARILIPEEQPPRIGSDVVVRGASGTVLLGQNAPADIAQANSAPAQKVAAQAAGTRDKARATPAQGANAVAEPTALLSTRAHVQVDLGPDFRVQGLGVDTRLAGQLTLTAEGQPYGTPQLVGNIKTVGGTVRAYSQQLTVQTGDIRFTGPMTNPALNILALRPNYLSNQRVGVQVLGTAQAPRVALYAEPSLPDNEKLSWLLLGRPAPSTGAEAAMLQTAALAILSGRDGRSLASHFGLDELSFNGGAGEGDVEKASVTFGKRLSDRLYATYERSLSGVTGTLYIFYELSKRWTLRGQTGDTNAVDLIFRLSYD